MKKYNYLEAVTSDVKDAVYERYTKKEIRENLESRNRFEQELQDDLWDEDSVTGNASGSYTFNAYEAEENICHNLDLLGEALSEFGYEADYMQENGAEACDVTIRCYLLGQAISAALDEIEDELEDEEEELEEEEAEDEE